MSTSTVVTNTGNAANIRTSTEKIFIGRNRYDNESLVNNSTYAPWVLPAGTVMGRVAASGMLVPSHGDASDGSQYPIGILAQDLSVDSGATVGACICVEGDVNVNMVSFFYPMVTLDTIVSSRRMRDRIGSDSIGINLVPVTEMSAYDNE